MPEIEAGQDTPVVDNEAQVEENAPEQVAEEATEASESEQPAEKTFTQAELDDILKKRVARAEAKAERRVLRQLEKLAPQQQQPIHQEPVDDKPRRDQFDNEEDYIDRLTDWKLEKRDKDTQAATRKQQQQTTADRAEDLFEKAGKISGLDRDDFNSVIKTPVIAQVIFESDVGEKLLDHLGNNPDEAERISKLSPARQAAELVRLEEKITAKPTVKPSKTPAPISPVGGGNTSTKSLQTANMDDYMSMRMKQKPAWAR